MAGQIKIGVFIPNDAQTLDVATVDILGVMSKEYIAPMDFIPSHLGALAPSVTVYYITTPKNGKEISLTSGMVIKSTHLYTDDEVAPGRLDLVVVPGPDPRYPQFEAGALAWLASQAATEGVDILSVCTGAYVCGASGIADGKKFSGPRGVQDDLRKRYPLMKLVGDDHRWVRDGNIWSSGGVTNGNDLMAAYAKLSGRWAQPIVDVGLMLTDVEDRGQFYKEGKAGFIMGFAWTVVKAWFVSMWRPKAKTV